MSANPARPGRLLARRWASLAATATAAVLTAGAIAAAGAGSAGASGTTYKSNAAGRFLSGSIGGQSLDVLVGIEGEHAANNGGADVTHQNSLRAELLNNAIKVPLADGLQLPGLDVAHLGAVAQYARANGDGSALGASGAVNNNGGIGVGGQNGVPPADATIDLSGLLGGQLASTLADLKVTAGALSARAEQQPGANGKQAGSYKIAGLGVDLTVPLLANLLKPVLDNVEPLLTTTSDAILALNLGGAVAVQLPDLGGFLDSLTDVNAAHGAIAVDLKAGTVHVDLDQLLGTLGLHLNELPPNTSLLPYLATALTTTIPDAVQGVLDGLSDGIMTLVGGIKVTAGGTPVALTDALVKPLIDTLKTSISSTLGPILNTLGTSLGGLVGVNGIVSQLLNIVVNGQSRGGGTFTEQAIRVDLGNAGGVALPASKTATGSAHGFARPLAAAPAQRPLVRLVLAEASVGPATPISAAPATPVPSTAVPATNVPTGVPAGMAAHGGSPVLPIALLGLAVMFAAGGALAYTFRGRLHNH